MPSSALIGVGRVRHARLRPVHHAFEYPTWFVMLPLRSMRGHAIAGIGRNRSAVVSFHDGDHGAGGSDALAWFDGLLAESGIDDVGGEVWLHTVPRVLGFAFKPVSFWYAHAADGRLRAVLAEVNNTFGERHAYLLHGPALRWGAELRSDKVFHVSPFCAVEGVYRFRFMRTAADSGHGQRTVVRIDHDDDAGPLLQTSVSGELQPLTWAKLWHAVAMMPLLGLGIVARIHLQALRLWLKRVPVWRKPEPPAEWVTR